MVLAVPPANTAGDVVASLREGQSRSGSGSFRAGSVAPTVTVTESAIRSVAAGCGVVCVCRSTGTVAALAKNKPPRPSCD